ncbi:MAG: IS256 family transposase [Gemmatimonadales bacterium]
MATLPPYAAAEEALRQLVRAGIDQEEHVTSALVRLGLEALVNRILEEERTDFLGRERYERVERVDPGADQPPTGYRNGYKPARVDVAEGRVTVAVPQVRQSPTPFQPAAMAVLRGRSAELERLIIEMYARGLSTRDIEDTFRDPVNGQPLLSRTAVSEVTEALWTEYQVFQERDLSDLDVVYLFVDALYEALRRQGRSREGILCAWAICADGRKTLVHLALGNTESYAAWLDFLRNLVRRGLPVPITVTSDGSPGLLRAIGEVWPASLRIRCWAHKMRNILDKIPDGAREEVKAHLQAVRDAPTPLAGQQAAVQVLETFTQRFPAAMKSFSDDLEASLAHLELPLAHRKHARTTNLIERAFVEERRRTKILPRFFDEQSGMKLVYAVLARASERWQRVRMTPLEVKQLALLRARLGLDPGPGAGRMVTEEQLEREEGAA